MPDGNGGGIISEAVKAAGETSLHLWMIVLALWGGTVSYLASIKKEGTKFQVLEYIARMVTSGFSGLLFGYVGLTIGDGVFLAFLLAGMGGHAGAAALLLLEKWLSSKYSFFNGGDQGKNGE